jgi:hypothetical protein
MEWIGSGIKTVVLGIQGSGKTYFVKNEMIPRYGSDYIIFDPNDEYTGYKRYVPKFTDEARLIDETGLFVRRVVLPNIQKLEDIEAGKKEKRRRLRAVIFDEADLILPARKNVNHQLRDLLVKCRHLRLDLVFVSRRPTDLSAYVMDTADYLVVFKQVGYNALKTLKALKLESDEAVKGLDYHTHEFLLFDRDRSYTKYTIDTLPDDWQT